EEGWAGFEWRFHGSRDLERTQLRLPRPRWQGEPLHGERILLHAEQGMGDVLQFVRYAPLVAGRGARVFLLVHAPLVRLLQDLPGVERVLAFGDPAPDYDLHCPLMSLPAVFDTRLESIPAPRAYLRAPKAQAQRWRKRLGET